MEDTDAWEMWEEYVSLHSERLEKRIEESDRDISPDDFSDLSRSALDLISVTGMAFDELTMQGFGLQKLRNDILRKSEVITDLYAEDKTFSRAEFERVLLFEEVSRFFVISGSLVETMTIELVMETVVHPDRRSKSVRKEMERKSQREREWILFVTGVLDSGQKGQIRRAYDLRSNVVHHSNSEEPWLSDLESDLNRTWGALNTLHTLLYDDSFDHRLKDALS